MKRIVVIGGVAAGMSAASQAKRRDTSAEVIVLERGAQVSYGACGMPYNIADPDRDINDLVVITAEQFRHARGIDVRVRHEAMRIDTAARKVEVHDHAGARGYTLTYDVLVIATGASAVKPPLPGIDLPGVFLLREFADGAAIKAYIDQHSPHRATIIGAGYIGMEMAESLVQRGMAVTMLQRSARIMPGFEPVIAELVQQELQRHGVTVKTNADVTGIAQTADGLTVETGQKPVVADIIIIAVGIRPNAGLAREAGIALGASGAIAVDTHQQTNVAGVYAAGDCAEAWHRLLRKPVYIPLGTTANKQGKVAGANAAGGVETFSGIVGTAAFRVFDLEVGRAGAGATEITDGGLQAVSAVSRHNSRGHHFPGATQITTVLFAERGSGRLLGVQMAGADVVAKRVDVFATALQAGMTLADIESLDLSYAPPFAPVYDPVIIAATVARKALAKAGA